MANLEDKLKQIESQLEQVNTRNKRVESDKNLETRIIRKFFIMLLTYLIVLIFSLIMKVYRPFLSAIVPSVGIVLMIMTIGVVKRFWVKRNR